MPLPLSVTQRETYCARRQVPLEASPRASRAGYAASGCSRSRFVSRPPFGIASRALMHQVEHRVLELVRDQHSDRSTARLRVMTSDRTPPAPSVRRTRSSIPADRAGSRRWAWVPAFAAVKTPAGGASAPRLAWPAPCAAFDVAVEVAGLRPCVMRGCCSSSRLPVMPVQQVVEVVAPARR